MKLPYKISLSLLCIYLFVPLYLFLRNLPITAGSLSDAYFMIALIFLMIGAFIAILSSGFFDFFQKNMKHYFRRKKASTTDYVKASDIFAKQPIYWIGTGVILLVSSFLLLIII